MLLTREEWEHADNKEQSCSFKSPVMIVMSARKLCRWIFKYISKRVTHKVESQIISLRLWSCSFSVGASNKTALKYCKKSLVPVAYGKHHVLHVRPKRWSGRMLQKIHMFSRSKKYCIPVCIPTSRDLSKNSFQKSQVRVSIGIHWVTECCTIGSWGRFRVKSSHQMLLCHWNDDSNMLKTSKWHQTGHLKKCFLLQVFHCVIPTTHAVKRAQSCQSCSSHGTRNLRQIFWVDGTQGWTTVKTQRISLPSWKENSDQWKKKYRKSMKTYDTCMIIYHNLWTSGPNNDFETIKKHQQSGTSHIYFDPFLSIPVMCVFFKPDARNRNPEIPVSLRKSSWCCDFFRRTGLLSVLYVRSCFNWILEDFPVQAIM